MNDSKEPALTDTQKIDAMYGLLRVIADDQIEIRVKLASIDNRLERLELERVVEKHGGTIIPPSPDGDNGKNPTPVPGSDG